MTDLPEIGSEIVVVTGAFGALGSAVVERLVRSGARVVAVDARSSSPRAAPERCLSLSADASDARDWQRILGEAEAAFGAPTAAALIAGGWMPGPQYGRTPDDQAPDPFGDLHRRNFETARRAFDALLPGMIARRRGSIVVVGSRAVERPWESAGAIAYATSKAALVALAQSTAASVIGHGVRINAVLPSVIDTPANRAAMPDADTSRWVDPSSLASVVEWLLSHAARDVHGASVPVYGRIP
jgi:NAD(P)-dependent dehydrogenase (short-subunit alcohol dehydrogenase family)